MSSNKIEHLDSKSKSNFWEITKLLRKKEMTLFLGAGVSASAGLPIWTQLVSDICNSFFVHLEYQKSKSLPKKMSIAFANQSYWTEESQKFATGFKNKDPLVTAEQIKDYINDADWIWLLRRLLYSDENSIRNSILIDKLVDLISACEIDDIITYNYDDLIELNLGLKGLKYKSISFEPILKKGGKQVIHPHGLLPLLGGKKTKLIFTETEYHDEFIKPYSWTNLVQLNSFGNKTHLFIGTSFEDINLRKLLRINKEISLTYHYAIVLEEPEKSAYQKQVARDYLFSLGIKTVIIPRLTSDDYSMLPYYIDLLNQEVKLPGSILS